VLHFLTFWKFCDFPTYVCFLGTHFAPTHHTCVWWRRFGIFKYYWNGWNSSPGIRQFTTIVCGTHRAPIFQKFFLFLQNKLLFYEFRKRGGGRHTPFGHLSSRLWLGNGAQRVQQFWNFFKIFDFFFFFVADLAPASSWRVAPGQTALPLFTAQNKDYKSFSISTIWTPFEDFGTLTGWNKVGVQVRKVWIIILQHMHIWQSTDFYVFSKFVMNIIQNNVSWQLAVWINGWPQVVRGYLYAWKESS
jgi:hypothetical protein